MAQNERSPGTDIIDVLIAIGVPNVRTLPANDKGRFAFDCLERAHRRINSPRDQLFGTLLQAPALIELTRHLPPCPRSDNLSTLSGAVLFALRGDSRPRLSNYDCANS